MGEKDGDQKLLDYYHGLLCEGLAEFGVAETSEEASRSILTREALQEQYEVAILDMGRLVFGYQWSRAKFGPDGPLNRCAYNKCLRSATWLTARCSRLLP